MSVQTKRTRHQKVVTPKPGQLRVWWIPQVPGKPFHVEVRDFDEAKLLLTTLARYDLFQFENNIKGDYANVGGIEEFVDGGWQEWNAEDGYDIDWVMRRDAGCAV